MNNDKPNETDHCSTIVSTITEVPQVSPSTSITTSETKSVSDAIISDSLNSTISSSPLTLSSMSDTNHDMNSNAKSENDEE